MKRRFDPVVLFERPRFPRPRGKYPTLEAEIAAVARGDKALSAMSYLREHVESTEFIEVLDLALRHGLVLVVSPDGPAPRRRADLHNLRVCVTSERELWRVPALTAMFEAAVAADAWSDALEAQTSALLGYTPADIRAWLAERRWNQIAWGCPTVYALLDDAQRARTEELGLRAFGPPSALQDVAVFRHRDDARLSPAAARRVPRGQTLARVCVDGKLVRTLFPERRRAHAVDTHTLTAGTARRFVQALRSPVQLLGPDGWSP